MLIFTDTNGEEGIITEDLEVDYTGEWLEDIENCIEQTTTELASGENEVVRPEDVFTELVIELPEQTPIIEIKHLRENDNIY